MNVDAKVMLGVVEAHRDRDRGGREVQRMQRVAFARAVRREAENAHGAGRSEAPFPGYVLPNEREWVRNELPEATFRFLRLHRQPPGDFAEMTASDVLGASEIARLRPRIHRGEGAVKLLNIHVLRRAGSAFVEMRGDVAARFQGVPGQFIAGVVGHRLGSISPRNARARFLHVWRMYRTFPGVVPIASAIVAVDSLSR